MILVFCEDGELQLRADEDEVAMHCGGFDVESGIFVFYDDQGRPLKPVFDIPNETRRSLWFFKAMTSGKYHLE